jgi:leader peptidase (prepilin peptidase)/N-methyltransferase
MLIIWLASLVLLVALSVYDLRWMLLPDKLVFPLIGLGLIFAILRFYGETTNPIQVIGEMLLGLASVAGVYYALHRFSNGRWVGFGDVKLGIFIGVILGWTGGIVALMAANLLGLIIILPGLLSGKLTRTSRIPFGPFLIAGCVIALLFAERIIDWYVGGILLGV